jgi:hypothetical protein
MIDSPPVAPRMTRACTPDNVRPMRAPSTGLVAILLSTLVAAVTGCGGDDDGDGADAGPGADTGTASEWEVVHQDLPGALLSVWGTSASDVWTVGSDPDGEGPTVLHYDGAEWQDLDTGTVGGLWWVFGPAGGPVYMGGDGGVILRYQDGEFTPMETPAADVTVFGIWGCSADDMWAVGGNANGSGSGFAWRLEGDAWVPAEGFPAEVAKADAVWKIYGRSCDDVWMVGTAGLAIHWDGKAFGEVERVAGGSLFTVHASSDRFVAVGGTGIGVMIENDGSGWVDAAPNGIEPVIGVCLTEEGGTAAGWFGSVLTRTGDAWQPEDIGTSSSIDESFHSVWIDPDGGVWVAGGQILSLPLGGGLMFHKP